MNLGTGEFSFVGRERRFRFHGEERFVSMAEKENSPLCFLCIAFFSCSILYSFSEFLLFPSLLASASNPCFPKVSEYGDRYCLISPLSYKSAPMEVESIELGELETKLTPRFTAHGSAYGCDVGEYEGAGTSHANSQPP
ncbi:hypothetical protein C8J56DRAFT_405880 [Mycena floridula]|nr:hypothetical protein C8J56DRAFT_405880 [Mycena floridula]